MEVNIVFKQGGSKTIYDYNYNKKKNYRKYVDVCRVLKYVTDPDKRKSINICGKFNLYSEMASNQADEMRKLLHCFEKKNGYKIRHFCFNVESISSKVLRNPKFETALRKTLKYFKDYPAVYALHEDAQNKHIHVVVCSVSVTGKTLDLSDKYLAKFAEHFEKKLDVFYPKHAKVKIILYT